MAEEDRIASRQFGAEDQAVFARLSGDVNPIHMDPIVARRTQAGARVVHGIHLVLWALDEAAAAGLVRGRVSSLAAQFNKFAYVGAQTSLGLSDRSEKGLRLRLSHDGMTLATVNVCHEASCSDAALARPTVCAATSDDGTEALEVSFGEAAGRSGYVSSRGSSADFARVFPAAVALIGAAEVSGLSSLSRLVGMVCPGAHSIFGSFSVELDRKCNENAIAFRVIEADERFRSVKMKVTGCGLLGSVNAFFRHPPAGSPTVADMSVMVKPNEFAASNAMVIGGSRGLGAVTAKLIAAGGGRVAISYATGRKDAESVAAEIAASGGRPCQILEFDAHRDIAEQLRSTTNVTSLYYFATGTIFREKPRVFDPGAFDELVCFYVEAFNDTVQTLWERANGRLDVFYPSSVFVDARPRHLTEYAMAKAAGEILCADLQRSMRGLRIHVRRLPRLATDQNAALVASDDADPVKAMLPIVREVESARSQAGSPMSAGADENARTS
jgi:NAD(P)-dependent dehydrogenase (short-subunit alcohol dehydrogenase family)